MQVSDDRDHILDELAVERTKKLSDSLQSYLVTGTMAMENNMTNNDKSERNKTRRQIAGCSRKLTLNMIGHK